ncbi:DUF11 domain-containing protein [Deinococcus sp. LM3]|uniref:beta strand repeat-containing protein n=1 Tax=Deinococcus sp. LM3 TaxID=1938608 RepID=UPI00143C1977|nr:DUF11 domain-containing protein [Deinococcus sp. LM3]
MYIIYETPTDTYKNMVIYEGFDRSQNELTTRTVNGLVVPSVFEARTSVLAWEGDETLNVNTTTNVAEALSFGAGQAPSAINNIFNVGGALSGPRQGIFNSTISSGLSSGITATATGRDDAYGVDFDTFDVTSKVTSGASSATLNIQGSQDLFYISSVPLLITSGVADLSLTKTVSSAAPIQGGNVTYTVTLRNDGPDPASGPAVPTENVQVRDILPAGLSFVSSSAATGTYDSATGIWSVPSPVTGDTTTLTITATVTGTGTITNVAEIISSPQPDSDSRTNNGITTEDDYASVPLTVSPPRLNVSKSFSPTTVSAGGVTALNITVTNPYAFATSALAITDNIAATMGLSLPLPLRVTANSCAGSTIVTGTGNTVLTNGGAAIESNDGAIRLTGGSIAANGTCSVTVDVTVVNAGAATRTNTIPAANVTGTVNAQAATGAAPATATLTTTASTAGAPYTCDARFYQIRQDTSTLLSNLYLLDRNNLSTGGAAQWAGGFGPGLNALAFNKGDGYFYALNITPFTTGAPFRLYRLGQSGAVEVFNTTIPAGSSIAAAAVDSTGVMYVHRLAQETPLYRIQLPTTSGGAISMLSTLTLSQALPIFDLAFNPVNNLLYGVFTPGGVMEINPTTGASVLRGTFPGFTTANAIGSAFFDVSGTLYAYQNGGTYGTINLSTGAFTTLATGSVAAQSDGASCVFPENRIDTVKSVGTVTAVSGLVFDVPYTVTVKNTGPVSNPNVQLTENLTRTFTTGTLSIVAGPTVTSGAVTANSGFNGTTNTALLTGTNTMAAGASATVTFTVRVSYPDAASLPASGSVLNNTVYASTTGSANPGYTFVGGTAIPPVDLLATDISTNGNTPPATANGDTQSATPVTLPDIADLAIDKSGPAAVGSGGSVTYTIRVWNNGSRSVTGASVTDALPAGFTVTGLSCAATGTATCGTQSFTASSVSIVTGTLSLDTNTANATPDGNFLTYTLTGTATATGNLSNTASVTTPAGTTDLTPANNTSAAVVTRVIDAVNDPAVNFGFGVGGTVTVLGNDTVGGAAATTTNATVTVQNNGGITGLTVNGSGQLVVPAGTPAGTYSVTYQICDATVTTACDTATVQVTVDAAVTSDLAVSKTGPAFAQPGGTITYTIRAWNNGPTVSSATVTDTVPADLTGVSWTCAGTGGATCGAASGSGNAISVGATLPVDTGVATTADTAFVTVTVTATAPSAATLESTPAARTITNTASVSGPNTDPTPANNSASAVTNMVYGKLTKEVRNVTKNTAFGTSGGGLPLEVLEYCIAFQNLGGAALPNFVLVDHVPGNTNALITAYDADEPSAATGFGVKLTRGAVTSYLSSSAADADGGRLTTTGGTFARGTMTVTLGTLAVGESGRACFQTTIR